MMTKIIYVNVLKLHVHCMQKNIVDKKEEEEVLERTARGAGRKKQKRLRRKCASDIKRKRRCVINGEYRSREVASDQWPAKG